MWLQMCFEGSKASAKQPRKGSPLATITSSSSSETYSDDSALEMSPADADSAYGTNSAADSSLGSYSRDAASGAYSQTPDGAID